MISYIKGQLTEKSEDLIVVEAGSIGYNIHVPASVLEALPGLGTEVKIFTHFQVREDAMTLFGFLNRQDLEMFRQLLGVNGVGPKSALGILSALPPNELRMAVVTGDVKRLTKAPGVGNRTAQRIILDLKDKVSAEDILISVSDAPVSGGVMAGVNEAGREAIEALTALGYSGTEAARAVKQVEMTEGMTAEDVLKASLKHLAF